MSDFWSLADKINTALLLVTALSVAAAFWQIRTAAVAQRATFLKDLYMQLKSDEAVAEAFYLIEYAKFTYDSTFHGSPLEKKVDRLLTLIDLVCEMRGLGVISKREMEFFRYQFLRVATDPAIRQYLSFLDSFYRSVGVDRRAFPAFQAFSQEQLRPPQ
jgi:membrane-associated PAP2 superfamily phosphatase